jgi:SAM-dependent methyltransferase
LSARPGPPRQRSSAALPVVRQPIPASGLISPAQQWAIQIEVTNYCGASPGCVCGKCSNCSRFTVHRADWTEWEPPYPYDAITGNHVLEHFLDAPAALEKMVASLAPGGKLYLELPAQLFDDGTSNERAWPNGLHNHDHWWHFSERTLRTWFENLGLTKIGFANTIREHEDNKLMDYHIVAVKPASEGSTVS